jgi:hypothetical protein
MKTVVYEIVVRLEAPAVMGPLEVKEKFEVQVRELSEVDRRIVVEKVRVASMYIKREGGTDAASD